MSFPASSIVDTIERDAAAAGSLLTPIARVRFGSRRGCKRGLVGVDRPKKRNCIFVKCKHDRLDRIPHAIVIMTTESCPRYFGFQAACSFRKQRRWQVI
jgi:hypothetical protein